MPARIRVEKPWSPFDHVIRQLKEGKVLHPDLHEAMLHAHRLDIESFRSDYAHLRPEERAQLLVRSYDESLKGRSQSPAVRRIVVSQKIQGALGDTLMQGMARKPRAEQERTSEVVQLFSQALDEVFKRKKT